MSLAEMQRRQFQERLQRIAARGPNRLGQLHAGPVAPAAPSRPAAGRGAGVAAPARGRSFPGGLFSGLAIGAAAVLVVRYLRFRLTGTTLGGADADILMITDLVLALTLAIIFRVVFAVHTRLHGMGKVLGVGAMVLAMHNLVFLAPNLFARIYSPEWVRAVQAETRPNSSLVSALPGPLGTLDAPAARGL